MDLPTKGAREVKILIKYHLTRAYVKQKLPSPEILGPDRTRDMVLHRRELGGAKKFNYQL